MTALLEYLLFMRYLRLKYIRVFDGFFRRTEELELANQKELPNLMGSRVSALVREPDRCAKAEEDYVRVSTAVNQLDNWFRAYYRASGERRLPLARNLHAY